MEQQEQLLAYRQGDELMVQKASAKKPIKKVLAKKAPARGRVSGAGGAAETRKAPKRGAAVKSKVVEKAPEPRPAKRAAEPVEMAKEPKKEKVVALSKSDLQYFRNLLLEKRREIIGDVGSMESEAFKSGSNLSNMPIHMADVGTDNFEQEFTLGLIESERQILREIQEALIRIDDGSFGVCQGTGKAIPRVRLEAMPWAKYTIEYKRLLDQGKISQDNDKGSDDESSSDDDEE